MNEMKVQRIENGTVIDHITAGKALYIAQLLHLADSSLFVIGSNLQSAKLGKKDIIKIEKYNLSDAEKKSIALIAPTASFTEIKNFKVVNKEDAVLPESIKDLIVCPNHNCITNLEDMRSCFKLDEKKMTLQCSYCERRYTIDEVNFKKIV